jgi:hypothetical protein
VAGHVVDTVLVDQETTMRPTSNAMLCMPATCTDDWYDVAKPVVARYQGKVSRIYFRADAAFAMPEGYEFLEAEQIKYAIRLPANQVLQSRICSRAQSDDLRSMRAGSMLISAIRPEPGPSRGGLSPSRVASRRTLSRVGFIVTNMNCPAERVVAFYNKRGTCE